MELSDFTLIIPTYNRPSLVLKLVKYLARLNARFEILILDSSCDAIARTNARTLDSLALNSRHLTFPESIPPFAKFARGAAEVQTRYCSMCADDDIVLLEGLSDAVEFLGDNASYSAAHGFYFDFHEKGKNLYLERWRYSSEDSLHGEPIERISRLLRNYHALTYAVTRTSVAQHAFEGCENLDSILAQELMSGVLCAAEGEVKRLSTPFYGRRNERFTQYTNFHPIERIIKSASELFKEYIAYAGALASTPVVREMAHTKPSRVDAVISLSHIAYLASELDPGTLEFIINKKLRAVPVNDILVGSSFARADALDNRRFPDWTLRLRALKYRYLPSLNLDSLLARAGTRTDQLLIRSSKKSKYVIEPLYAGQTNKLYRDAQGQLDRIIAALDDY